MAARFLSDLGGTLRSSFRVGTKNLVVSGTTVEVRQWTGGALADLASNKLTTSDLVVHTNTEVGTSGTTVGTSVTTTHNPTGASSGIHRGLQAISQTQAGNAQNFTGRLVGIHGRAQHNGSGTVTQAMAYNALVQNANGGIITEGTAVYISTPVISGGSITTAYGLYIENQTGGGTNYAIYTNTGKIRIGDTSSDSNTYVNNALNTVGGIGCQGAMVVGGVFHAVAAAQFDNTITQGLVSPGTSGTATAVTCTHTANPIGASTAVCRNLFATRTLNTNVQNLTDATSSLIGLSGEARHEGTGTVTAMSVLSTQVFTTNSSGTVTSAFGLNVFNGSKAVGTTIGTLYGIHVASQTAGTVNWAIFTNTGVSRFGDRVLINTSTNDGVGYLQVNGSVSFLAIAAPGSPVNGSMWYDSTQASHTQRASGITSYSVGTVYNQTVTRTIGNTTTETTFFTSGVGGFTLPANFWTIGKTVRIRFNGTYVRGANANHTFRTKLGATTIFNTSALTAINSTVCGFWGEAVITCRTTGATGTVMCQSFWSYNQNGVGAPNTFTGPGVSTTTTVDTTASAAIDMTAQWSVANAGNIFVITNLTVEVLG